MTRHRINHHRHEKHDDYRANEAARACRHGAIVGAENPALQRSLLLRVAEYIFQICMHSRHRRNKRACDFMRVLG
jgi:hypothetical protein